MRLRQAFLIAVLIFGGTAAAQEPAGLVVHPVGTAFAGYAGGPAIGPVTLDVTPTQQVATWTAVSDQPWLAVTPAGDEGPGQIRLTVTPGQLSAGTFQASVTLYTSGTTPLIRVPVVVTLTPAPSTATAPLPPGVHLTVRAPLTVRVDRRAGDTSTAVFVTVNKSETVTVNGGLVP